MKAIKTYIWMAVATMMVAALGACSSDDFAVKEAPIQKGKTVTLTATLSPKESNTDMRALTDNGTTIGSAWALNEEVCVEYTNGNEDFVDAKGIITAVDDDGKATITVDLINPKEGDSDIFFHYPYNIAKGIKDLTADQIGTLDDIAANFDDFDGDGTLNVTGDVATLPSDVSMTRNVCIWKLAFKVGSSDITNTITALNINISDGAREYDITPNELNAIYVALGNVSNTDVTFKAATPSGIYSFKKDEVTLNPGYYYRSTVTLTAANASGTYREYSDRTTFDNIDIPEGAKIVASGTTSWSNDTYVVNSNVIINNHVAVMGNVNLILMDGASLTVNGTITGSNLNIYGQELSTGKLDVVYHDINVSVSNLAIHGGIITVTEGGVQQGIEAMNNLDIYHGKVTTAGLVNGFMVMGDMRVFGGNITASSTGGAALQIYGAGSNDGSLTMTGGTFRATGTGSGSSNKGILVEKGNGEGTATITISGGTLIATGGISNNSDAGTDAINIQGTLTISGNANVTANGGTDAYDMGGGYGINVRAGSSAGGNATISGGTVTATSGPGGMAAINTEGDLTISGATTQIDATGGDMGEGILASGTITISGGNVTATAGENGIGLEGTTTISGGVVTAIGGDAIASSGADGQVGFDGSLTMTGGKLIATGGAKDGTGDDGLGISDGSTIALTGVTMYEGTSANPTTQAASQTVCTKRYVIIK